MRLLPHLRGKVSACEGRVILDGLGERGFLAGAHALDLADRAGRNGGAEIVDRPDAELAVQQCHRLRTHTLQPQHVEQACRKLRRQFAMERRYAGRGELFDARGDVLADTRQRAKVGSREVRDALARVANHL